MRKAWAVIALCLVSMISLTAPANAAKAIDIVVEDTAGVLDTNKLIPAIQSTKFHKPTKVAVYTRNGQESDNLNEEVLRFARENHPEWLSEDKQKWADSLFIFALDPEGRQVGTYMGEDRKVSLGKRDEIQKSTKSLFRDAQWTDGTIAGIEKAASIMNRPWYKSASLWINFIFFGSIPVLIGAGIHLLRKHVLKKSSDALLRANQSYSRITMDLDATELHARIIPESSRYGSIILERYRTFMVRYNELTVMSNEANSFTENQMKSLKTLKKLQLFAKEANELDTLDDIIADTSALLDPRGGWNGTRPAAWDRQVSTLKEELGNIESSLPQINNDGGRAAIQALKSYANSSLSKIEILGSDLSTEQITPDDALDRLREMRAELTGHLRSYSDFLMKEIRYTEKEERTVRHSIDKSSSKNNRDILGLAYREDRIWSVYGFRDGYRSGQQQVVKDRERASSSGSGTTGYGRSGGSFSGSGSSSRF